jgi:hypothetical protein
MKKPRSTKAYLFRGACYLFLLLSAFAIPLVLGQPEVTDSAVDPAKTSFAVGRATTGSAEAQPSPVVGATAVVVWDQYNNVGTAVTLSGTFNDAPAMNSDLADDFDVQGIWIVRWIDVDGAYFNGPGPANTFSVLFYSDNDGFPGNQIYATSAWWEQNGSTFRVHVCDDPQTCNLILYPGRYWIEIQANMTAACCGEWGWTDRIVTELNGAAWRNPSGFFGACTNWSRRAATCGLDPTAPDQVYRIYANLLPTPTPTVTPTATATPTATFGQTPTPTVTPSEPPCEVNGSQPACNSTISTQVTDFTVYVSYFIFGGLEPGAFTVNGTPADDASPGGSLINFHFNVSPVVQGENTMHIPAGAFSCINGRSVEEFTCTFTYQAPTPTPAPRSTAVPRHRPTPAPRPTR